MSAYTDAHTADCLCRRCHRGRYVECIIAPRVDHPDHLVPECPATPPPALGAEATCRTCRRHITWEVVEEWGYLPRTGWSDKFPRDALVCFKAADYRHVPTTADYDKAPLSQS